MEALQWPDKNSKAISGISLRVFTCCLCPHVLVSEHCPPPLRKIWEPVLQRTDLVTVDKDGNSHPLLSNEAVARVFKRLAERLADRLQGIRVWCRTRPL
jgi:hypothetical protein